MNSDLPVIVGRTPSTENLIPPTLKPSLIPWDILSEYEKERARVRSERRPGTSRTPVPGPLATPRPVRAGFALDQLQRTALFAGVAPELLGGLCGAALERQLSEGQVLFSRGDASATFFLLVRGKVEFSLIQADAEIPVREFGPQECLGVMGVFRAPTRTGTARAISACTVLEFPLSALEAAIAEDETLRTRFLQNHRNRVVQGFLATSGLFPDLPQDAQLRVAARFQERLLVAGETLIQPGEVSTFLAVVLAGSLQVSEPRGGAPLQAGTFLAATSAVSGQPSRVAVTAAEPTHLVWLDARLLAELRREFPQVGRLGVRLPAVATSVDRDLFRGGIGPAPL